MTKNKKRKSAVREVARAEGLSFTRANLLNDRNGNDGSDILKENATKFFLATVEPWIGWNLKTINHPSFTAFVAFDSNSPNSRVTRSVDVRNKTGIPHWVIAGGTQEQRFRFLDGIRDEIESSIAAYGNVLSKRHREAQLSLWTQMHKNRLRSIERGDVENFAQLRIRDLEEYGSENLNNILSYVYLFIYDWHETMADASQETKDAVQYLVEHGKKTGIHVVISVQATDEYVSAWGRDRMVRWIKINDRDESETVPPGLRNNWEWIKVEGHDTPGTAVTVARNEWVSLSIPEGNLVYKDGKLVNPSLEA